MTVQRLENAGAVPPLTLGWRMKMAMAQAGLSQRKLADVLDVDKATVNRWVTEQITPKRWQLMAFAMATGVPFTWLETGKAPADKPEPSELARPEGFEPPTS